MEFISLYAGDFMADGGAVFGVVPKVMWEKRYQVDEKNFCKLTMRCLLVKHQNRVILVDTGAGMKQPQKYRDNNGLDDQDHLMISLEEKGIAPTEITDVILTHLHWDHAGGNTYWDKDNQLQITFPNATYWVSKSQYENAVNPNRREASAYFKDDFEPLVNSKQLKLIDEETTIYDKVELRLFNGHTPGMIIPIFHDEEETYLFTADLLPVAASLPVAWVAAYDLQPVVAMDEKEQFLKEIVEKGYYLFFEHDAYVECASVKWTGKHPEIDQTFKLKPVPTP
ncbi:MBL fold metallo-hydrolase [Puteibacter caeruleilacunae]|nr:MBL fold metallo-hydrolase [Puteibacter caeruleilacunae]